MRATRRLPLAFGASLLLHGPACADAGFDSARAIMAAMQGERCGRQTPPDEDWADRSWPLTWRNEFQAADEPDRSARLIRLYCDSGAYNVLHAWFVETAEGVAALGFAMPAFTVSRATEEFDSAVTGIKVTGFRTEFLLVNSDFGPADAEIVMNSFWRGIGDAFSIGKWTLVEGEPVLTSFEVDASYDGEQTPETIYRAEPGP